MCVTAICYKRKLTHEEFLKHATGWRLSACNVGLATLDRFWKWRMPADDIWKMYSRASSIPHVVHFCTTCGITNPNLIQPYIVSEDSPLVQRGESSYILFQSGTIWGWEKLYQVFCTATKRTPEERDRLSGARVIAMLLPRLGDNIFGFMRCEWVVIRDGKIIQFGDFVEDDGVQWSYNAAPRSYYRSSSLKTIEGECECLSDKIRGT